MCTVCGCSGGAHHSHEGHAHAHAHAHVHGHADGAADGAGAVRCDGGPAGTEVAGVSQRRLVKLEQDILGKNDAIAAANRRAFESRGMFVLNLVSSPGAGKTTLLVRTLSDLAGQRPMGVIEGDQQSEVDAERIRATGLPAVQVNTGKGCHLDAEMVRRAVARLDPADGATLFIENVGNLVCPAGFDLGEAHKVVIASVTEGADKPLKYPNMFAAADLMLVSKIDLLPHLEFDVEALIDAARRVNPDIEVLPVSATSGFGMSQWYAWIAARQQRIAAAANTAQAEGAGALADA